MAEKPKEPVKPKSPTVEIQLYTQLGEYVASPEIVNFAPLPQVILWGERAFQWQGNTRYRECFCVALPGEPETKKD